MKQFDRWVYNGDTNLEYGGNFIDLSTWDDGYCEAVRVTELDSSCGFTGDVMIEHVVINGTNNSKRIREACRSSYSGLAHAGCKGKESLRHAIAEALLSYGYFDMDDAWDNYRSGSTEIIQTEEVGLVAFEGWKVDTFLSKGQSLEDYVWEFHLGGRPVLDARYDINPQFRMAIEASPQDIPLRLVYADWLDEHDHGRLADELRRKAKANA